MAYILMISAAVLFVVAASLMIAQSPKASNASAIISAALPFKSEFRKHADRIAEIRNGGTANDGIHILSLPVKISEDDFLLMGCDNSSAKRNHPNVARDDREEGRWFAGARDLKPRFGNFHGTIEKDGTEIVEAFYTTLPRPQYRASPEEVAWHYVRVTELRAQGMPTEQRIAVMTEEAVTKPWEKMR